MLSFKNVLILSPHTDDSELGAGGLIARLIAGGARVTVMVFCNAVKSVDPRLPVSGSGRCESILLDEFNKAATIQKVNTVVVNYPVREFSKYRQEILDCMCARRKGLDLVLTPCAFDTHQDHQVIYEEACRAFRRVTLLGYELPWNHVNFTAPLYVHLTPEHMACKWAAVSCYTSQIQMKREYFTKDFIYGLARVRGVQAGSTYAEAFQLIQGISV